MRREPGEVTRDIGPSLAPDHSRPAERCAELLGEVRHLLATIGREVEEAAIRQHRAADLLTRLSEQVAGARQSRLEFSPFDEHFAERYLELRTRIEAFGRVERSVGNPPEHAVKALKSLFEDARAAGLSAETAVVVERDMVRWGIDGYYAA